MTRSHEKIPEPYHLAALAQAHGRVMQQSPLDWARSMHTHWTAGAMRPNQDIEAKTLAKIQSSTKLELVPVALKAIKRGENELRLQGMFRAIRLLSASKDPKDAKMVRDFSMFLTNVWGIKRAAEVVADGECDVLDDLKAKWGDAQLPPLNAMVLNTSADELLIEAAVRRLG